MSKPKRSPIGRALHWLIFGFIPLVLILGALVMGWGVLGQTLRLLDEQTSAAARADAYAGTATAIAPSSAGAAALDKPLFSLPIMRVEQEFVTNTPNAMENIIIPAVNTAAPSPTLTATPPPSSTPLPTPTATPAVTSTPRPLPTLLMPGNVEPRVAAPTAIPTQVAALDRQGQDILNILLMGNDGELSDDGFIRTDTMIVVSVNRTAGTVGMISLPRDLYLYMPGWTMNRLNIAYTYGESAGWTDGGFGLMRETLFYNLGINVHYYAMVDLTGFKEIVDAVGGIEVAVDCAIQDYALYEAEIPQGAFLADAEAALWTLPVGYYQMSGAEALWYARSRGNSSDFDRGRRQQQVLRAIWRQARDSGQLERLPDLWNQGMQLVETNIPFEEAISLLPIALNLDPSRMEQFTLRRTYDTIPWQPPSGDFVQLPVYEHILELLTDLYQPPTTNQIVAEGARIAIYNGSTIPDLDRVAASSLGWAGFNSVPAGAADNDQYSETILIDYTGATKGSSLNEIARLVNVTPANIRIEPNPNRTVDFDIIVGSAYNACTHAGVLPVEGEQRPPGQ